MMSLKFEYTKNMKNIFQEKLSELKTYYCREDFVFALEDFDVAPKDAREFRKKDLRQLCETRGMEVDELIADRTLLNLIPTRKEMQEKLLQSFYEMYENSPHTTDFMERIVRRLAPEYNEDTVRVAILKKFLVGAGKNFKRFHIEQILEWGKKRFNKSELKEYDTISDAKKYELVLSKIDDSIFKQEDIKLTETEILLLIVKCIEKYKNDNNLAFTDITLSEETQALISTLLKKYQLSEEESFSAQIQNIAIALKDDIFSEEASHLLACVEREFRMKLKTIKRESGKGTADTLYMQAKKDALKTKKRAAKKNNLDFELLDMCTDLASGNFRVNGKTKVYLYYFAFMFDMKLSVNEKGKKDDNKDIVKNLFQDFYNDNLLRLLSGDYANPEKESSVEHEPTGEGINYKNFVEVIYLYFLCHDELEMLPGEKIDKAEELIKECVKKAKKPDNSNKIEEILYTKIYREDYFDELLRENIDGVVDYILKNYQIISQDQIGKSRIMIASEENTAVGTVEEIMESLDEAYPVIDLFDIRDKKNISQEIKEEIFLN